MTRVLTVSSAGAFFDEPVIRRVGDQITVTREFLGAAVPCAGAPTVFNTDTIKFRLRRLQDAELELGGGPFAPGATPEPDASPEIEVRLSGSGTVFLNGGPTPDHFRFASGGGESGVNLDAGPGDRDIDVIPPDSGSVELFVDGGKGADTIDVAGHLDIEVAAFGGPGNDTLYGRHGTALEGALFDGGDGNDRIVGGPDGEGIFPGRGRDTVIAGAGDDVLFVQPDRRKDRFDCGPGADYVLDGSIGRRRDSPLDRFDRLRSCGRVSRRSR